MNIYKRQMDELGLDIDQYSNMIDIPKSIVNKMVNGNGEVVENNMEINNFLRKNLFGKHQEIENNKEEKKVEALNVKLSRGENSYENKKQFLLDKYPESKEVKWYIYDYDKNTYFAKYNIKNRADLMRRYNFTCNTGRLKGANEIGITTIERLTEKKYDELGVNTAYPLICQLYDCLELGNIKERTEKARKVFYENNAIKGKKGFQTKEYTKEEKELRKWFTKYDINKFVKTNHITYKMLESEIGVSHKSLYAIIHKRYIPSCETITKLKDYVERIENKDNLIIPDQHNDIVIGDSIMQSTELNDMTLHIDNVKINTSMNKEEISYQNILRNLLKDRLTEEEKTLIILFGGKIDD